MRLKLSVFFIAVLLMGCSALSGAPPALQVAPSAQAVSVAWGERVAFSSTITGLEVFDANGRKVTDQTFDPGRAFVDLPAPPTFPGLDISADPLSEAKFFIPLTLSEKAPYVNRGRVLLRLSNNGSVTRTPYGAVLSGQVHALASVQGGCSAFFSFLENRLGDSFSIVAKLGVPLSEGSSLCHATLGIGQRVTAAALVTLEGILRPFSNYTSDVAEAGFVLDKNSLGSLDQGGRGLKGLDPTCDQIKKWLDPIGNNGYGLVDMTKLRTDIKASALQTGAGVNVVIIGGGIGQSDDVRCSDGARSFVLRGHDTHVRTIIQEIAPGVSFQAFKVCNSEGTCSSAEIVRALMRTLSTAKAKPKTVINMSLGGPLADKPSFELLRLLGQLYGIPAIVSAGNGPFAPAHYPASFSTGLPGAPSQSLPNVIPVAAAGFRLNAYGTGKPGYVIAGFNTRANAVLFAPGVNLCPVTAEPFRCDETQSFPDDLGLTGTSYAAPVATGLAALYTQKKGTLPTNLGRCLANNVRRDLVTKIVAFGTKSCP